MRILNQEQTMTTERLQELRAGIEDGTISKGKAIRECFAAGMSIKEMSDKTALNILYNHCYNVANQEVLKHGLEVERTRGDGTNTKKAQILALREAGHSLAEISKSLGVLYNQVWQVCNKAGLTDKQLATPLVETVEEAPVEEKGKKGKKVKVA